VFPDDFKGAVTIGCVACRGGRQFTVSAFRLLRKTWPEAWWRYIVTVCMGEIILSIKYDQHIDTVGATLAKLGGLAAVAKERPWLFDFTAKKPLPGYVK
jgi:hypothetical protein